MHIALRITHASTQNRRRKDLHEITNSRSRVVYPQTNLLAHKYLAWGVTEIPAERLALLAAPDNLARVERTLAHLESSSQGLDRSLKEVPQTLAAVRQVFSKDNLAHITRSLDNIERLSADAVPLAREGRSLIVKLQTLGERVDSLAGTRYPAKTTLAPSRRAAGQMQYPRRQMGKSHGLPQVSLDFAPPSAR